MNNSEPEIKKKKEIIKTIQKREVEFTILSVVGILILLVSSSYALFSSVQKAQEYNSIKVGSFQINFTDTDDGLGNTINLNGAYPVSDAEGQATTPYTFKIKNIGSIDATYTIKLQDDEDMINADNCSEKLLDKSKLKYSVNGDLPNILSTTESSNYTIITGKLGAGKEKTYSLRAWIDELAGNEVLGKHYHGKIVIESVNNQLTNVLCKRATTLHTEECTQTDTTRFCSSDGYSTGDIITYGSLGTQGVLTRGDAFDCDVDGDGTYDSESERFYYITEKDSETAIMIYYSNTLNGIPDKTSSSLIAYTTGGNVYTDGPISVIPNLPTTVQWSNVSLTSTVRNIIDETNVIRKENFSYEGYSSRLITRQEVGILDIDNEPFLLENTIYSSSNIPVFGYWLESAAASSQTIAWLVTGSHRKSNAYHSTTNEYFGTRPVIEVSKTRILY